MRGGKNIPEKAGGGTSPIAPLRVQYATLI
jgi:hypothetical protein